LGDIEIVAPSPAGAVALARAAISICWLLRIANSSSMTRKPRILFQRSECA
jgi:hypothetical protein